MYKGDEKRPVREKSRSAREREKPNHGFLSTLHLKKVYPISIQKSSSPLSPSSSSQNSNSSLTDSATPLDQKIKLALRRIAPPVTREDVPVLVVAKSIEQHIHAPDSFDEEGLRRCYWITKSSDRTYVQFHDECWGVPVFDDNQLFELLAMSGMLMDYNWTEILKKRELLREAFSGFDPNKVAKMGEEEIMEIASDRALILTESRARCIVDNAKCIIQVAREFGSFSSYMWNYVNYKPVINRYRYPRNVPLRTPKAEVMSRDLLKRGFRFVGPVIVYSFMQACGMTIDHLVDCFRFHECASLAERPWRPIV
ncbi:DNA-3-methyladenine glycosylase I [Bertholletia excelsa]